MDGTVRITRAVFDELLAYARREPGLEICGLLAGRNGVITAVLPAENALASATAFTIAPAELFTLFHRMRAFGFEHAGIYHSHPAGDNAPSPRDIEQAYYPGVAYIIVSPAVSGTNAVRAFAIQGDAARELAIEVVGVE
ncbi:MAG TPA: M67 family metallopeptidase [Candidatus Acidoferrales bacterium]|nr:M67 family metallopeptidase [Candidatus Acidoferrales bacterium]